MNAFLESLTLDGDALNECPYCRGNNLHQESYSIYEHDGYVPQWSKEDRGYEHKPQLRVTHVMGRTITTASVDPEATNDPSRDHRGALMVEFSCEGCENKPILAMFQHKGTTFLGWKK